MKRPMGEMPRAVALPRQQWSLIAGFVALLLVGAATAWLNVANRAQTAQVEHTLDVRQRAAALLQAMTNAETGQRGYLITGKQRYADTYALGSDTAPLAYANLVDLTVDNPRQRDNLVAIQPLLVAKLDELKEAVTLVRQGETEAALAVIRTDRGKDIMDALRLRVGDVVAEENRILTQRRERARQQSVWLLALSVGGLVLAALLGANAIGRMRRYSISLETANAEVEAANAGLEANVAERTADLQLANDEIQRFAYIVSHDLRAPLVNIMGFTSELEQAQTEVSRLHKDVMAKAPELITDATRAAVEVDMGEAIAFIRTSTERMDRLIGSILRLSREGQRNLAAEPLDMTALIEGVGANVRTQLEEAEGVLTVRPLPGIRGDRLTTEQIFANLIENAIKYRDAARPVRIEVTGSFVGRNVAYAVADNGRGIAPADHSRVFDLFRRAGQQTQPGEGIGLASVRTLARRIGGSVTLASALGEGSTFTVTLPVDADMISVKEQL